MPLDKAGVDLAGHEFRMRGNPRQKIAVGHDTERRGLGESAAQQAHSRRAILARDDDLGD